MRSAGAFAPQILLMVIICLAGEAASAQDTQPQYRRKSISFVNSILITRGNAPITAADSSFFLRAIQREIEMPRFDYNPLSEEVLTQLGFALQQESAENLEGIAADMNQHLAPEILRIVDYEKDMRALGLLSESERHSFIVEKAKETGITAEHLQAVMNSAYIGLPVITHLSFSEGTSILDIFSSKGERENRHISVSLGGALLWFAVRTDGDGTRVELAATKAAMAFGAAHLGASSNPGKRSAAQHRAFAEAADILAVNLKTASQEIPDFRLTHPLTDAGAGWIEFTLGRKEGLNIDDKYIILEYQELPDESLQPTELGLVRISRVAKNLNEPKPSRARTVIGRSFQKGMLAIEHPRLPIDLSVRFNVLPVSVKAGSLDSGADGYAPELKFDQASENLVYIGQLGLYYNLARSTGISQFFASVYGEIGGSELAGGKVFNEYDLPAGFYWGIGGGLAKKYYWNRLHLGLEALLGYASLRFDGADEYYGNEVGWEWRIESLGFAMNGCLELALGYDLSLGGGLSYRIFAPQQDYVFQVDGQEVAPIVPENKPEVDFSGWGIQVYLTYSLPSLSLNPLKYLF
ncbi:MAG TPA: hypothetical protein VF398_08260 [bacterium]|jgi:hypothetical protein